MINILCSGINLIRRLCTQPSQSLRFPGTSGAGGTCSYSLCLPVLTHTYTHTLKHMGVFTNAAFASLYSIWWSVPRVEILYCVDCHVYPCAVHCQRTVWVTLSHIHSPDVMLFFVYPFIHIQTMVLRFWKLGLLPTVSPSCTYPGCLDLSRKANRAGPLRWWWDKVMVANTRHYGSTLSGRKGEKGKKKKNPSGWLHI